MSESNSTVGLKRSMGLVALTLYGVGDMLGSGIYALIGKAAAQMGSAIWLAFLASAAAALTTALSYASLGSRYPKAAGAAYVTHRAFGSTALAYCLGLAVLASGLTSMATASRAFSTKLGEMAGAPALLVMVGFIVLLTVINFVGITQSAWANALCTVVETAGLLLVIAVGARYLGSVSYLELPVDKETGQAAALTLPLVMVGAVLTFYSFVGFEDMLNVSEEVKDPARTFPWAIVLAIVIVTVVYMLVALVAVSVLPHATLAASKRPLEDVVAKAAPWVPRSLFAAVTLFAIANTALLNFIMGSRLVYGMSRQGLLPAVFGRVHAGRRTPHVAIGVLAVIVMVLAGTVPLKDLANATSLLLLTVFVVVNGSLIVLKRRASEARGAFEVPTVVPALGVVICGALISVKIYEAFSNANAWQAPALAGGILVLVGVLYVVQRPQAVPES